MNRPKPRPKVESTPASGTQTPREDAPKKEQKKEGAQEDKMDVEGEDAGPRIEEMDVD